MIQTKTVENRVLEICKDCHRARQHVQALSPELYHTPPQQDMGGILVTVRIGG